MPDMKFSSYFYGDEAMQFTYFRIPCQLITHPRFKHLSTDSKLLYGMLLDRMSLSIKNEWYDDTGRVYIYYTVDEMAGGYDIFQFARLRKPYILSGWRTCGVGRSHYAESAGGRLCRIGFGWYRTKIRTGRVSICDNRPLAFRDRDLSRRW